MFSYYTAVFGLKQNQLFHESSEISKLLLCRNCIIHQHITENDDVCGWPGVHYHGLFEYITNIGYDDDRIIKQIKICCSYFSFWKMNPLDYLFDAKKYEMILVFDNTYGPTDLNKYRKINDVIQHTSNTIPEPCLKIPQTSQNSILSLCKEAFRFDSSSFDKYLTPTESADFVHNWCLSQNIDTGEFVNNWIYCLDSELPHKNTLFFQGVNNSCSKAILDSVIDACEPVGKVYNLTTGYKFFWKNCWGKRMIALYDPHFDKFSSTDKLLEILEGTESSVAFGDNIYLPIHRTPIVIIAQECSNDRKLHFDITNRLVKGYFKLKSFQSPVKKLHPMWLCELAEKYYVPWRENNTSVPNVTIQERSAETNIIENAKIQQERSVKTNITKNASIQPGRTAEDDLLREYLRISNLHSSQEESDASDCCSELSEDESNFMDSSRSVHCENSNEGNTSDKANKHVQEARESGVLPNGVENSFSSTNIEVNNKRKRENDYGIKKPFPYLTHEKYTKKRRVLENNRKASQVSSAKGVSAKDPSVHIRAKELNLPDPTITGKGKSTKGVPTKNRIATPLPGPSNIKDVPTIRKTSVVSSSGGMSANRKDPSVFNPCPLQPQVFNSSATLTEKGKLTKGVPTKNRKATTPLPGSSSPKERRLSAKEKIMQIWKNEKEKHPESKPKCTYKNLMPKD